MIFRSLVTSALLIYVLVYKFAVRFVYSGTMYGSQAQLGAYYSRQRTDLIFRKGGERFKLETEDGNTVDTMYFDRRK